MSTNQSVGVKQRIQSATSPKEIQKLLELVASYTHAHPSTVHKCERAAARRLKQLELLSNQKQPTKKEPRK